MWVLCDITPWPRMNRHYLSLAGGYHAGDASWPLTFPASLRNTVCSWPGTLAFAHKGPSDFLI